MGTNGNMMVLAALTFLGVWAFVRGRNGGNGGNGLGTPLYAEGQRVVYRLRTLPDGSIEERTGTITAPAYPAANGVEWAYDILQDSGDMAIGITETRILRLA